MGIGSRYSGYKLIEFSSTTRTALSEVADRLIPREKEILGGWMSRQYKTWKTPEINDGDLRQIFAHMLSNILSCLHSQELESCIKDLEKTGAELANRNFPFEALLISIHFLEESYVPFLLTTPSDNQRKWLLTMDEFVHVVLAAMATAYFEAYRKELLAQAEVGQIVQESLLAEIPSSSGDLEVAHAYLSAREQAQLGGDFLDSFNINNNTTAFLIGDLSGHGVEAAADSLMLRSLFRGFMREQPDLVQVMVRLNKVLEEELNLEQFATALAVVYEQPGQLKIVNAGHPFPILCGEQCCLLNTTGTALSISSRPKFSVVNEKLPPGGVFVAYTDGVTEARRKNDMFGEERLLELVTSLRNAPADAIVDGIINETYQHSQGKFRDDVAILVLKRKSTR